MRLTDPPARLERAISVSSDFIRLKSIGGKERRQESNLQDLLVGFCFRSLIGVALLEGTRRNLKCGAGLQRFPFPLHRSNI